MIVSNFLLVNFFLKFLVILSHSQIALIYRFVHYFNNFCPLFPHSQRANKFTSFLCQKFDNFLKVCLFSESHKLFNSTTLKLAQTYT